jgi:hypothetical protein
VKRSLPRIGLVAYGPRLCPGPQDGQQPALECVPFVESVVLHVIAIQKYVLGLLT